MTGVEKLRVLCLHGYHSGGSWLETAMRSNLFQFEGLEETVEFVFADAPSLAEGDFGWWHARDPGHIGSFGEGIADWEMRPSELSETEVMYDGWSDRTLPYLTNLFREKGPFHGLLGFDQGAACTALLAATAQADFKHGVSPPRFDFKFAILISGWAASDGILLPNFFAPDGGAGLGMPSLHCFGSDDIAVSSDRSEHLASAFVEPFVFRHNGGHEIPTDKRFTGTLSGFLLLQKKKLGMNSPNQESLESLAPSPPQAIPLWNTGNPQSSLLVHRPAQMNDSLDYPALLVIRGEAYKTTEGSGEGTAELLARAGIVACELNYRLSWPHNYADVCRAMRLIRELAPVLHVDPERVGIVGYGSGGHLAALVSTQPLLDYPERAVDDLATLHPVMPSRLILAYPLISFVIDYSPGCMNGAVDHFFEDLDPPLFERERVSAELHVSNSHPPVFAWTTADNAVIPPSHLHAFVSACNSAYVSCEALEYPSGGHGLGLAQDHPDAQEWPELMLAWLGAWKDAAEPSKYQLHTPTGPLSRISHDFDHEYQSPKSLDPLSVSNSSGVPPPPSYAKPNDQVCCSVGQADSCILS